MPVREPFYFRAGRGFVKFWRNPGPRVAAFRDLAAAALVVLGLLGGIWIYSGQPLFRQAPLVVVESGSMMHGECPGGDRCGALGADEDPPFGRWGTIDPGDLVLVKSVGSLDGVETAFDGGTREGYGGHGDVVVFRPMSATGKTQSTPIIHRAMIYVKVETEGCRPNDAVTPCRFIIPETCNTDLFRSFLVDPNTNWASYCLGSVQPITFEVRRGSLFLKLDEYPCRAQDSNCPPFHSGLLTKGDNNGPIDQPMAPADATSNTCCPVRLDQVIGVARGEIPWFGLIKLSLYGNPRYGCDRGQQCSDPTQGDQWRVLRAVAPKDLWLTLLFSVVVLVSLPILIDHGLHWVRRWRQGRGGDRAETRTPARKGSK